MAAYVDSHFHIWKLKQFNYPWPGPDLQPIFRDAMPDELCKEMLTTPVRYGVFVQVLNNNLDEAKWVLEEAKTHPFIKGIIAGVDFTDPNIGAVLDELGKEYSLIKGARHILDFELEDWITRQDVHAGLHALQDRELTFDLLLRLRMAINHIAKPLIKEGKMDGWKDEMQRIANFPNIYCKLSGLITEADWEHWKPADIQPYVQHVVECFGPSRCMFGSDWPVCTLAHSSYHDVVTLLKTLLQNIQLSADDISCIFRESAISFYKLEHCD